MPSLRTKFDEQLDKLNNSLLEMGEMVSDAIAGAAKALEEKDISVAKKIIDTDDAIDEMEKEIERRCLKIILRQAPVAGDLKLVSTVLKIITDLERIGDHATDISEITIFLAKDEYVEKSRIIPEMAKTTRKMLDDSIKAFVEKDLKLANEVIAMDDVVDDLFVKVRNECIEGIKEDIQNTDQAMDVLMIAKYFERVGDHATNIAEWVVFSLTGLHKETKIM